MQLRCLLVGLENVDDGPICAGLANMAIRCDHVTYAGAPERLYKNRYEAIVLFYDGSKQASDLVNRIRGGHSNRDSVIFAASTPEHQNSVFRIRANFFLNLPITEASTMTIFKAAYGLLVRSRARWHREPVTGTAYLNLGVVKNVQATILNLSQGGMSVRCPHIMRPQQLILARFGLPGTDDLLCLSAQVIWSRTDGTIGVRFTDVPEPTAKVLRAWVEDRLELAKVYATFRDNNPRPSPIPTGSNLSPVME